MKKMFLWMGVQLILTCFGLTCMAHPEATNCYVVSVTDGDSFKAIHNGKIVSCRLVSVDAPELAQAFGLAAKDSLASLIGGKLVSMTILKDDRYGRLLVRLSEGGRDIQEHLVEKGMAWVYTGHANDRQLLATEAEAQQQQAGLWGCKRRVSPWQYRGLSKQAKKMFANCE